MRNSAIELLRAAAALMIVLSHACVHSGIDPTSLAPGFNRLFLQCSVLGNLGVNIFVLISGYYLSHNGVNYRALLKLLLQVWFYSLLLFAGCRVVFDYPYTVEDYHRVFLPLIFNEYWFCTAYVMLFLLAPFLNLLINAMDRKLHRRLLGVMIGLWCILPAVTGQYLYGDVMVQFAILYLLGAWFRKYPDTLPKKSGIVLGQTGLLFLLLLGLTILFDSLSLRLPLFAYSVSSLYSRNSPVILGCAAGLFAAAISCRPFTRKWINQLGACALGIYLIHDNPAVRYILWQGLLKIEDPGSTLLPVQILLSVFLVYTTSAAMEFVRIRYLEQHLLKAAEWVMGKVVKTGQQ